MISKLYAEAFKSALTIGSGLTVVILQLGIMGISEIISYSLEKREGSVHALNEGKELTGSMPMTKNLPKFTVAGEKIEPKINLYSSEGKEIKTYTYILGNKKDVWFHSYFGIPDNGVFESEFKIIVDGQEKALLNEQYNQEAEALNWPLDKINEITIIVSGNAKLWDVGISEMKHWWE